jgi:hypothetical protein
MSTTGVRTTTAAPFKVQWEKALLRDQAGLRLPAIAVAMAAASYASPDGSNVKPKQETLAEGLGVDRDTVGKWVRVIERAGWLVCTKRGSKYGGSSEYRLSIPSVPAIARTDSSSDQLSVPAVARTDSESTPAIARTEVTSTRAIAGVSTSDRSSQHVRSEVSVPANARTTNTSTNTGTNTPTNTGDVDPWAEAEATADEHQVSTGFCDGDEDEHHEDSRSAVLVGRLELDGDELDEDWVDILQSVAERDAAAAKDEEYVPSWKRP